MAADERLLSFRGLGRRLCLLACLGLGACEALLFYPSADLDDDPSRRGLAYRELTFASEDGVALHGWWLPPDAERDRGCSLLFLHGNAGNVGSHLPSVDWLPAEGYGVLIFDYRGFGLSEGEAELAGLHRDFDAALDALLGIDGVVAEGVIVFGQSLGGAVAVAALAESPYRHRIKALVIEGAPSGYRRITQEKLADFWLTWPLQAPLARLMNDDFRPLVAIPRISPTPVLVVHGLSDRVVPPHHGRALYEAALEPKAFWSPEGVGHIAAFDAAARRKELVRYLGRCSRASASGTSGG